MKSSQCKPKEIALKPKSHWKKESPHAVSIWIETYMQIRRSHFILKSVQTVTVIKSDGHGRPVEIRTKRSRNERCTEYCMLYVLHFSSSLTRFNFSFVEKARLHSKWWHTHTHKERRREILYNMWNLFSTLFFFYSCHSRIERNSVQFLFYLTLFNEIRVHYYIMFGM